MLGSARGGRAVSRALGGLYGGRVSCHVSIMYGTHSRVCAQPEYRGRASVACLGGPWVTRLLGGSVCPSQEVIWMCNWRGGGPGGAATQQQEKEEEEEEEENCDDQPSQYRASLCPGMAATSSITKDRTHHEGRTGRGWTRVPSSQPVNSSVLQGRARCEMADGRWQQGTPGSVWTGWAGWWAGGAGGGASRWPGWKGTMKTIIACCNLDAVGGIIDGVFRTQPTFRTRLSYSPYKSY